VDTVDDRIRMILDDMAESMYASDGLGRAGAQVGILRKLVVIDVGDGLVKLINPEIVSAEGEVLSREGCLSVPNLNGLIRRPEKVVVKALKENGEDLTIERRECTKNHSA
jgi:peptide deformylase